MYNFKSLKSILNRRKKIEIIIINDGKDNSEKNFKLIKKKIKYFKNKINKRLVFLNKGVKKSMEI